MTELPGLPCLAEAVVERRLPGGLASESWLVRVPQGRWVVRLDRPLAAHFGLDRKAELDILGAAGDLAPPVVDARPEQGILVTQFLDRRPWTDDQLRRPAMLDVLGERLAELHSRPARGKRFDPLRIAQHYAQAAGSAGSAGAVEQVARLVDSLSDPSKVSICHHDAHAGNLLGHTAPVLVDWEYAAVGDPLMDLVVTSRYHALSEHGVRRLLDAWSGGTGRAERERFDELARLYDLLNGLWTAVRDRHGRVHF